MQGTKVKITSKCAPQIRACNPLAHTQNLFVKLQHGRRGGRFGRGRIQGKDWKARQGTT
jgi:hypothetical protein